MDKKYKHKDFKTPEGYFEGLTERLMDKMVKETSDLPENSGFKTPDGYFGDLNQRIREKIEAPEPKVIRLKSNRKYYFAAASVAALLLLVFTIPWGGGETLTFEGLANTDLEHYLEEDELSTYELAALLPEEELDLGALLENELDEENIIEYLDDTLDDLDELNLEYDE